MYLLHESFSVLNRSLVFPPLRCPLRFLRFVSDLCVEASRNNCWWFSRRIGKIPLAHVWSLHSFCFWFISIIICPSVCFICRWMLALQKNLSAGSIIINDGCFLSFFCAYHSFELVFSNNQTAVFKQKSHIIC